jgi:hypothetical protein
MYDDLVAGERGSTGEIRAERWLSGRAKTFVYKFIVPTVYVVGMIGSAARLYETYPSLISGNAESLPIWLFNPKVSIVCSFVFMVGIALAYMGLILNVALHIQNVGYRGKLLVVENRWHSAGIPFENVEAVEQTFFWYFVRVRFNCRTPFGSVIYYAPESFLIWPFDRPANELRRLVWPSNP